MLRSPGILISSLEGGSDVYILFIKETTSVKGWRYLFCHRLEQERDGEHKHIILKEG